ncbi:uncharacterized protein (TIGR00661 family) [Litorivivens lipolytica]|uniref:Uncharacterized protein (TIGR00661 family) n=1 Tax=Litorivivens lipolytica TaxID=1524264 RepID=A0A7W4W5U7_9GAMM|nr:MJ1255/VC2487 family glycosyltransferase [Litorivivens lipolytica]MBB3048022.1 uncharacterized protein (TIGR00661 family) [Litorivivens lipolytica]
MKILYGVQGTGNGHVSRARMMASHFTRRGVQVDFLFSGRAPERYFDMECFGHYQTRTGLSFVSHQGSISYLRTVAQSHPIRFLQEIRELDVSGYDVILTDFEPITAWAGKLQNRPVIGIGHQYAFHHPGVPRSKGDILSRFILRCFAPVTTGLGLHWSDFGGPIVPPIINPAVSSRVGNSVLVYLPFEDQSRVTRLLKQIPDTRFIQYSPDLVDGRDDNVDTRKTSLAGFKQDLQSSRAVICNAGFELISECLYLGKAVLAKPVTGQGEQIANAMALSQLNYADILHSLEHKPIANWLNALPVRTPVTYPDVAAALVDWVLSGEWHNTESLSKDLWKKTRLA